MRAYLSAQCQCDCGNIMWYSQEGPYLHCMNPDCPNYGKKFKVPSVELEQISADIAQR